jgi:ferritin
VANEEKDYATANWIQWFVNEQIQEESSARIILDKLALAGEAGLYFLDRDIMSLRAAAEPTAPAAT